MQKNEINFFPVLVEYVGTITADLKSISEERKSILEEIADYVSRKLKVGEECHLIMVCIHNSRRSHFAQVWAQVAAAYFGINSFKSFSGGDEVTSVHPNTIAALKRSGILLEKETDVANPFYTATFGNTYPSFQIFSKLFDDASNPDKNFGAILVCVNDAQACPFIPNADVRIGLPYNDPKFSDGTSSAPYEYDRCCLEIATEMFYVMNMVSHRLYKTR